MPAEREELDVDLPDPNATRELGRRLGELLFPGAVVALAGQLGAGKTFLCRAVAEGLGIPEGRAVTSPTFVLVQEYEGGRLPVYHFDTYRLRENEFAGLGAEEYFEGSGVCLVEWADRVARDLPGDRLQVELTVTGPSARRARVSATGPRHAALLRGLRGLQSGATNC
jgi:tRNA threonylcarbamoyladenosine biosynthesis protein TsaE